MGREDIITDRDTLRLSPPDVLLTNYKMLDYLLIRPRDFPLWKENGPETLRYLVGGAMAGVLSARARCEHGSANLHSRNCQTVRQLAWELNEKKAAPKRACIMQAVLSEYLQYSS